MHAASSASAERPPSGPARPPLQCSESIFIKGLSAHWEHRNAFLYDCSAVAPSALHVPLGDPELFWRRHLDSPAHLRHAAPLFDPQLHALDQRLFSGWSSKQLHRAECTELDDMFGHRRSSSSAWHAGTMEQRDCTADTFRHFRAMAAEQPRKSQSTLFISWWLQYAESEALAPLCHSRHSFFAAGDIFSLLPPEQCSRQTQLLLGARGCYSSAHEDLMGVCAVAYMLRGEKLWLYARPEAAAQFHALFPQHATLSLSTLRTQHDGASAAAADAMQLGWIRQREHDVVVMPPNWPHLVYHLSDTAMLAWGRLSPLSPRSMRSCIEYAKQHGRKECDEIVPLQQLFECMVRQPDSVGISQAAAEQHLADLSSAFAPPRRTALRSARKRARSAHSKQR